jgi:hypothetical protein
MMMAVPGEKKNFFAIKIGGKILAFSEEDYDEEAEKMIYQITRLINTHGRGQGFGPLAIRRP